jgi:hypothetical protein
VICAAQRHNSGRKRERGEGGGAGLFKEGFGLLRGLGFRGDWGDRTVEGGAMVGRGSGRKKKEPDRRGPVSARGKGEGLVPIRFGRCWAVGRVQSWVG